MKYVFLFMLLIISIFSLLEFGITPPTLFLFLISIYIFIKDSKTLTKETWQEFKDAKTTDGTGKIKKYFDTTTKITANQIHAKHGTQAQLTSPVAIQKGAKSLLDELKDIFK